MIYTCTLNPAVDLFVELDTLTPDVVNRTNAEDYIPNGKTINISFILNRMGVDNKALGYIGGFTGNFIKTELENQGIQTDFIEVDGITRINTFIRANEQEYKIVNRGPVIPENKVNELLEKIGDIPSGSVLFVSGSLPRGVKDDIFVEIAKICHQNKVKLVLDISSKRLLDCLSYQPFIIKPNEEELAFIFDKKQLTKEEIMELGQNLVEQGAQQVLISLGEKGSLYISKEKMIRVTSPKGKVVNTACAGDALLGSFCGKLIQGVTLEEALMFASATGASTAFTSGLSDLSDVHELMKQITIYQVYQNVS
ncbi:1-phosphofructokinase [Caldibacillus thermoamylovorans]|uniref:1-phosphofructokinase n=1 Tax=Caldibacillus thermoamylovorans TaxID=35841 RepID=UPI001D0657D0|nr:1-phosphofructokinase [Caldibacillus thermoamylovorans]MCB5936896.1 1-phosphofructokinase [Bacillus sp. DFI.2.34]MCB7078678.1 1-phosphofructokinase [Caldibacillus thermoamylovorans]